MMTATMDFHTELITLQNELKKYIFHHQMLRLKNKNSKDNIKTRLVFYEKKIVQLSERQKLVINNLRKERIDASSSNPDRNQLVSKSFLIHNNTNQKNLLKPKGTTGQFLNQQDKQQQQLSSLRPFNSKKFLIPVSAAAATSKKTNQQILVVSTPDGGARLAASTNATRPTLSKSSFVKNSNSSSNGFSNSNSLLSSTNNNNKSTSTPTTTTVQLNNFTITNTTKSIVTLSSNTFTNNTNSQKRIIDKSSSSTTLPNITTATHTNSLLSNELITTTSTKRKQIFSQNVFVVDKSFKDNNQSTGTAATAAVVVVTKVEPKIDESKMKEEFFTKLGLVTKQALTEIQNKKSERKRRTTANPQFSNAAIEAKRITAQELAAKKANRKRELAASNQDSSLNINNSNAQPTSNKRSFLNSNRGKQVVGGNKQQDVAKKNLPKVSNKQLNQNNEIKISSNCFVCDEICDSDLDEIMFCEDCHCLFHVTCSSTIDSIKKTMGVPCPKCERKRSLTDDGFNDNSNESNILKQKSHLDSSNSNSSSIGGRSGGAFKRKIENNKSSKNVKLSGKLNEQSTISKQQGRGKNEALESKLDEERYENLVKYQGLDRQVRDFKVKLALLKDKVYYTKENRREMLIKKENSKREIESIINLVKMIQELENSSEQKENQVNHQEHHLENDDLESKINDSITINDNVANEQNIEHKSTNVEVAINNETTTKTEAITEVVATASDSTATTNISSNNYENLILNKEIKQEIINDMIMIDETNEAVNNLNALAGLAVAELDEINKNKLAAANTTTTTTTTISNENQFKNERPDNIEQQQQQISNHEESPISIEIDDNDVKDEQQNIENVKLNAVENSEQPIEIVTSIEVVESNNEIITTTTTAETTTNYNDSIDEPPSKKVRLSPEPPLQLNEPVQVIEEPVIVESVVVEEELINQDLDEVSAAIASIPT